MTDQEQQEAPKIEFPCEYPIKVVGRSAPDYKQFVIGVILKHAADLDLDTVELQPSRNGNFSSVRFTIIATGVDQLEAIFEELKASGRVTMVI
ncbi:MAG: DUF493 domain-containing protein [Pseudomonadales bacterium]